MGSNMSLQCHHHVVQCSLHIQRRCCCWTPDQISFSFTDHKRFSYLLLHVLAGTVVSFFVCFVCLWLKSSRVHFWKKKLQLCSCCCWNYHKIIICLLVHSMQICDLKKIQHFFSVFEYTQKYTNETKQNVLSQKFPFGLKIPFAIVLIESNDQFSSYVISSIRLIANTVICLVNIFAIKFFSILISFLFLHRRWEIIKTKARIYFFSAAFQF